MQQQEQTTTTYRHFQTKPNEALFDRRVDLITSGLQPRFSGVIRN
ncbi:MAG TPA: hypothetical protein VE244_15260 [Nitrososphaeraceae archaeon]|jgi:hypothetical protein|nr:hypothetical protein [Nitrososphaeraceae archaeon]